VREDVITELIAHSEEGPRALTRFVLDLISEFGENSHQRGDCVLVRLATTCGKGFITSGHYVFIVDTEDLEDLEDILGDLSNQGNLDKCAVLLQIRVCGCH
jgi:hypothetical protein